MLVFGGVYLIYQLVKPDVGLEVCLEDHPI